MFAQFNSGQIQNIPLFLAYQPSPALAAAENALMNNTFTTMNQRAQLFQTALTLSMQESWWGLWVVDTLSFEPYNKELAVASDRAVGIGLTPLWPYTLHYKTQSGGTVNAALSGTLIQSWNPINGSNWTEDATIQLATADHGLIADPNTGLNLPKLVQSASVVAKTGLPIFNSSSWLTLTHQDTIPVPADAWADWDAVTQTFITAQQRHAANPGYTLTANIKSTVTYVSNLWQTKWHDGSSLSPADFVIAMIMKFDPGKPASKIFDQVYADNFLATFMTHFKGVKILSTSPLVIETYEDQYSLDAENSLVTWYPASTAAYSTFGDAYQYGTAAWHNLAPAIQAEADGVMAFSLDKADSLHINETSLISGPTLAVQAVYLNNLILTNAIPYAPTLGSYLTPAEISARYAALKAFYQARGHLWIGTGPYFIDQVNTGTGTISLAPFAGYLFSPSQFWSYSLP
jgi:peptide/nickel transport system substrate-binding protein